MEEKLRVAVDSGDCETVKICLQMNIDINYKYDLYGNTALYIASRNGNEAAVQLLIENGADVNATNKTGETALHKAAEIDRHTMVKLLLENGADVNIASTTGESIIDS